MRSLELKSRHIVVFLFVFVAISSSSAMQEQPVSADVRAALDRISPESMRGHLSFIASDRLQGRDTPSPGLDIAAEYIAAQFRRAGLEPVGDDGYFQTAGYVMAELDKPSFQLTLRSNGKESHAGADQVNFVFRLSRNWNLDPTAVVKVPFGDMTFLSGLSPEQIAGKVVMTEPPDSRNMDRAQVAAGRQFLSSIQALKPALVIPIDRLRTTGGGGGPAQLVDPDNSVGGNQSPEITLLASASDTIALFDELQPGMTAAMASLRASSTQKPSPLRNVIGMIRGSDPALADTYVFLTAHYDHVGVRGAAGTDNIFNGANDNGSGTVSVIEIASALASLKERPRRSLVFMTVFGEERGMLGSSYYLRHPIFPVEKIVADINLEQVGRTDSTEGPQVNNGTVTGFDYSEVGQVLVAAGMLSGIEIYKHERNSDAYFGASDNSAFASQGVPAHSFSVAFNYPDYHGAGDHWDKIDYDNMARVDRTVALALLMIANNPEAPKWNETNPRTAPYVSAWKERHPSPPQ